MNDLEDRYYRFDYCFSSSPVEYIPDRLVTEIKGKIHLVDLEEHTDLIGTFQVHQILAAEASNMECPLNEVMDVTELMNEIGKRIFDCEIDDLKEEITRHYEYNLINSDYFILTRMEIEESHRKQKVGLLVIDDILRRFSGSARLFILKAFPLQFEGIVDDHNEADYLRATGQLVKYYAQLGFEQIPEMGELMFFNPSFKRERLKLE